MDKQTRGILANVKLKTRLELKIVDILDKNVTLIFFTTIFMKIKEEIRKIEYNKVNVVN